MHVNNFSNNGDIITNFYPDDVLPARGDNVGTIFRRPVPPPNKKIGRAKTVQNFSRFLTTFDFDREYLRNGSTNRISEKYLINYSPSHVGRKNIVNFGPQTKKLLTCILTHPSGHFSVNYISALRGCCALKFLHALEIDQGHLAHTPTWTGVPPQKKI